MVTVKAYLKFLLIISTISLLIYMLLTFIFSESIFTDASVHTVEYGFEYAKNITINNLRNFLQYMLFFFISPLLIIIDLLVIVYQIWLGVNTLGGESVFLLLYKHGIIEFPNMVLYMFLSLKCMLIFYNNFNINEVFFFIKYNYKIYLLSLVGILIAGIIEGVVHF